MTSEARPEVAKKPRAPSGDYGVGYGKPPRDHQFKKGQSGNPRGRPKRAEQKSTTAHLSRAQLLQSVGEQSIPLIINGESTSVSMIKAVIIKTFQAALAGKQDAVRTILQGYGEVDEMLRRNPPVPDDEVLMNMSVQELSDTYRRLMAGEDFRRR